MFCVEGNNLIKKSCKLSKNATRSDSKCAYNLRTHRCRRLNDKHHVELYNEFVNTIHSNLNDYNVSIDNVIKRDKLSVSKNIDLNEWFDKSGERFDIVAKGSYNEVRIFKTKTTGDKTFALRGTILPLSGNDDMQDIKEEVKLSLQLSEKAIVPHIHKVFVGRINDENGVHLYIISDFANQGTLYDFMSSSNFEQMSYNDTIDLARRTKSLYTSLVENNVFCIDIKSTNAVVNREGNKFVPYLIDFDTYFCSTQINEHATPKDIMLQWASFDNKMSYSSNDKLKFKSYFVKVILLQLACSSLWWFK